MKRSELKSLIKEIINEISTEVEQLPKICSYCQKEFGIDPKKLPSNISHGICKRHIYHMYKMIGYSDEEARNTINKTSSHSPDLAKHPEIVQQYKS